MATIYRVIKRTAAEAVQINSPEEEEIVRAWLAESGVIDPDLKDLIQRGFWFLRDEGSTVVFVATKEDFPTAFEVVGTSAAVPPIRTEPYTGFTF